MASFAKNIVKTPGKVFDATKERVEKSVSSAAGIAGDVVSSIGDALTPDIVMPEAPVEEVIDPQEAVTEAAQRKRARVKKQQEQSTLLAGAKTGGGSSLLG